MVLSINRRISEVVRVILLGTTGLVLLASPALAAFDVPDSCRAGRGTYNGQLTGEASYSTCILDGIEKINIRFVGDWAKQADYPGATAITYAELEFSDSGMYSVESNGRKDVKFTAQFGACGITGSWQILHPTNGDVEYSGTFDMPSTGAGILCDPNTNSSTGGGGGSSGGTCGLFGSGGLLMAAPMLLALRRARPQIEPR